MTTPPLPASPCLRIGLDYTNTSDTSKAGSRFFLSYEGAAPTPGNCATIAGDIAAAWASHISALVSTQWHLTEVDVLDIATYSGASGSWEGSNAGSNGTTPPPANCAINVEFDIARRYRGGKPRMFLPPGDISDTTDAGHWSTGFITSVNTDFAAFMAAVEAISVGAVGVLAHVNLRYYSGFKNIENSSGRMRAVPQYLPAATLDTIQAYSAKVLVGSQRRRRASTAY